MNNCLRNIEIHILSWLCFTLDSLQTERTIMITNYSNNFTLLMEIEVHYRIYFIVNFKSTKKIRSDLNQRNKAMKSANT